MNKKQTVLLIREYEAGGVGYRTLAGKYGTSLASVSRMIKASKKERLILAEDPIAPEEADLPDDVAQLKQEIRKLKLKLALQDTIIDISGRELGVDLRKKRGTRQ